MSQIVWFNNIGMQNLDQVGGKIASLGEMITHLTQAGVKVPHGFATTAQAYHDFLRQQGLKDDINNKLASLDVNDVEALSKTAQSIRDAILKTPFLPVFEEAVANAYQQLALLSPQPLRVAVRSSATAEDLPNASFAGQQDTYLNVDGLPSVLKAIKKVFASLYTDRAIAYRAHHQFDHHHIALAAGIQQMVRSDLATSGVMFTLDTESGFDKVVLITAAYGLGEAIVQGDVNPDEFYVYKPNLETGKPAILRKNCGGKDIKIVYDNAGEGTKKIPVDDTDRLKFSLSNEEIESLARLALIIEKHYGRHMDIEWGKDGLSGELFILQARPETVKSRHDHMTLERYQLPSKGEILSTGRSVGQKIGQGKAKVILSLSQMSEVKPGDVLVTEMTDPDWEPIMKRASAIVTNRGGRTCHAAIIAREAGIPAVVGCQDATIKIPNDCDVTVSCAEGETGFIYRGIIPYDLQKLHLDHMKALPVKIMLNIGNPERAFDFQFLPNAGVGLARIEFIINNMIGIHPNALLEFAKLPESLQSKIFPYIVGYGDPVAYYIERLKEGIATLAAAFYPKPIIVRFSDFKSNEYANLIGGQNYEPVEDNPMLGFRGASRYVSESFRDCFELEVKAVNLVRDQMGLDNVWVMVPFVRTLGEAKLTIELLAEKGLKRSESLKIIMMCEIPSNVILADAFLEYFDGFSIGSNDLTQLTLGVDRDSGIVANLFDERDPAIRILLKSAIDACKRAGKYIGICGQGPSDNLDFAHWLINAGIESISLNPDTVLTTWLALHQQTKGNQTAEVYAKEPQFNAT